MSSLIDGQDSCAWTTKTAISIARVEIRSTTSDILASLNECFITHIWWPSVSAILFSKFSTGSNLYVLSQLKRWTRFIDCEIPSLNCEETFPIAQCEIKSLSSSPSSLELSSPPITLIRFPPVETWNGIFLRMMTNDLKPYQSNTASSTCRDGIYLEFTPALSMDDKSGVHIYIYLISNFLTNGSRVVKKWRI